ncbi:unnamed protein product [Nippostrongylus brasiliensis]|uniref:Secreted protein n=1 Tax=Nippostrongylus brasiliensis TaxID=27835 RepID=A0A0N4XLL1_NIPBR|nr:unnamed protein product [Nippostrongylus brasiliensis]
MPFKNLLMHMSVFISIEAAISLPMSGTTEALIAHCEDRPHESDKKTFAHCHFITNITKKLTDERRKRNSYTMKAEAK